MVPNLALPDRAPKLGESGNYAWDNAAFALYSLVSNDVPLEEIAHILEKQWLEQGNETHLVRPAPHVASFESLRDVLNAHIALDKGKHERSDGPGDLDWWPTAFIIVVDERWREPGGLVFVYADEERDCAMNKFFFRIEDAYMMLSSLIFGDEEPVDSHECYAQVLEP